MAEKRAIRSVFRSRISDYPRRKQRRAFRRAPSVQGRALASESPPVVSSRLRNFLCGQVCQGEPARPQSDLLGTLDWIQVLDSETRRKLWKVRFGGCLSVRECCSQ